MQITAPIDDHIGLRGIGCCGVYAVAVATGVKFADSWRYLARGRGPKWTGGAYQSEILDAIKHFGGQVKLAHTNYTKRMVKDFSIHRWIDGDPKAYVVFTRTHVLVVQGKKVIDQGGLKDINSYHFARKRIDSIYEIVDVSHKVTEVSLENMKQEMNNMTKKVSKFNQAKPIVAACLSENMTRKDILAKLTVDLDTTWNAASTFYHKILKDIKAEQATAANQGSVLSGADTN